MSIQTIHLGDGAYASIDPNKDLLITANHHLPTKASDVVCIERDRIPSLVEFLQREGPKREQGHE